MIEQGTAEWHAERLGKATASRIADIVAQTKTGYSAARANYAAQLVAERQTGAPAETFSNAAMVWGTENEPRAREAYEFRTGAFVDPAPFVPHPTLAMSGASPDGYIGDDGLLEIKCPQTATHIATLRSGKPDAKYLTQMQWQMACTRRAWCDFVSYDPRLSPAKQLFIVRISRDDARIAELEREVAAFLAEVDAIMADLDRLYPEEVREAA